MKEDKKNKICSFCGNKNFRERTTDYIYKVNQNFFIVNNVPCEECEYCGEQYFKSIVLKKIESEFKKIYTGGKKKTKKISVPIEEFENI